MSAGFDGYVFKRGNRPDLLLAQTISCWIYIYLSFNVCIARLLMIIGVGIGVLVTNMDFWVGVPQFESRLLLLFYLLDNKFTSIVFASATSTTSNSWTLSLFLKNWPLLSYYNIISTIINQTIPLINQAIQYRYQEPLSSLYSLIFRQFPTSVKFIFLKLCK